LAAALIGRAIGAPALNVAAPAAATALLVVELRRQEARHAIHLHLLAAAVVAYALLNGATALVTTRAGTPLTLLPQIAAGMQPAITPIVFYFLGVTLCAPIARHIASMRGAPPPPTSHNPSVNPTTAPNTRLTQATTRLACALAGIALPLAGWAVIQALRAARSGAPIDTPISVGLPDPASLANLLALAVVITSASDAPNATLRFLLGAEPDALASNRRWRGTLARAYRLTLALVAPLGALALIMAIALTWSRMALLATGVALVVVSVARRRAGRLVLFALAVVVALALVPRGFSGWFGASFVVGAATLSPAQAPTFMATLAGLTVMGLALARLWVAYDRLRPTSGAAGLTLAALGAMAYALVASMTSAPLSEPVTGVVCWLLLGMASGVADALEQSAGRAEPHNNTRDTVSHAERLMDSARLAARLTLADAARGYPLRTLYVMDDTANAEARAALAETIRAFDGRRVAPQIMTLPANRSDTPTSAPHGGARGMRRGWAIILAAWRRWVAAWRRWATLLRVALDTRPDLLVAVSPGAYLPTVFAGRLIGVPVQWHAREVAPAGLQRALDLFAPWTSGIVACSQHVARSFQIEALGARVRVVRMGVAAPAPITAERRRELRASLGITDDDLLLIAPGEIASGSGHADLIQAMRLVRVRYPRATLLLASEARVGDMWAAHDKARPDPDEAVLTNATSAADTETCLCADPRQGERLACAIALNHLGGAIQALGPRADLATVIGACDLAVFPQWSAPFSRGLTLALAQGVPIIATQAGALPEQLTDAWGCLLVEPRDPAALAEALTQGLSRLGALRTQARHNRTLARDWQSAAVEAARLQTLYRQLCLPTPRKRTRALRQPTTALPTGQTPRSIPLTARSYAWAAALWNADAEER